MAQPKTAEMTPEALSAGAMRTFFRIAEAWGLTTREQIAILGSPPRSTFYSWKRAEQLAHDGGDSFGSQTTL